MGNQLSVPSAASNSTSIQAYMPHQCKISSQLCLFLQEQMVDDNCFNPGLTQESNRKDLNASKKINFTELLHNQRETVSLLCHIFKQRRVTNSNQLVELKLELTQRMVEIQPFLGSSEHCNQLHDSGKSEFLKMVLNYSLFLGLSDDQTEQNKAATLFHFYYPMLKKQNRHLRVYKERVRCFKNLVNSAYHNHYRSEDLINDSLTFVEANIGDVSIKTDLFRLLRACYYERKYKQLPSELLLKAAFKQQNVWDFEHIEPFLYDLARMNTAMQEKQIFILNAFSEIVSTAQTIIETYLKCLIVLCMLNEKINTYGNIYKIDNYKLITGGKPPVVVVMRNLFNGRSVFQQQYLRSRNEFVSN